MLFGDAFISIWNSTLYDVQKKMVREVMKQFKRRKNMVWENTPEKIQQSEFKNVLDEDWSNIWHYTCEKVQEQYLEFMLKRYPNNEAKIWGLTETNVQNIKILKIIQLYPDKIPDIWMNTQPEVQTDFLIYIKNDFWNNLDIKDKKEKFPFIIKVLSLNYELVNYLNDFLKKIDEKIDSEKLIQLLTYDDFEFIYNGTINEVLLPNIGNDSIDVDILNPKISKLYNIFLTNNLP